VRKGAQWYHETTFSAPHWKAASLLTPKNRRQHGDFLAIPRLEGQFVVDEISLAQFRIKYGGKRGLQKIRLDTGTAWLCGLYVAEGCYDGRQGPCFTLHHDEQDLKNRIIRIARALGIRWKVVRARSNGQASQADHITVFSNSLGRALEKWCGKHAENKRVPEFILLHKDPSILDAFLRGYLAGDGHHDKKRNRYTLVTISKLLALQLQLAYARLGKFAQISERRPSTAWSGGRPHRNKTAYSVRFVERETRGSFVKITDDYIYVPVRRVENQSYVGDVCNIETTDNTYLVSNAVVHNCVPVAAGGAWASRHVLKEDRIVALFIGDAATGNAQFFEGINAAAIKKVPLLVVIEDNHLAGNVTPDYYFPEGAGIEGRLAAFGIERTSVDGNKIDKVVDAAQSAIEMVRKSSRPHALICDTTRLLMHKLGQRDVRTQEQLAQLAKRDPITYFEQRFRLRDDVKAAVRDEETRRISSAIDSAHKAPWPSPDDLLLPNEDR
jgi:hypothetical protein